MYNDVIIMKYLPDNDFPKLIPLAIDPNCHCGMVPDLKNGYIHHVMEQQYKQHHTPSVIQITFRSIILLLRLIGYKLQKVS